MTLKLKSKAVNSKIEITPSLPTPPALPVEAVEREGNKFVKYHHTIDDIGQRVVELVEGLCPDNILTQKLGVWKALQMIEGKLRERKGE